MTRDSGSWFRRGWLVWCTACLGLLMAALLGSWEVQEARLEARQRLQVMADGMARRLDAGLLHQRLQQQGAATLVAGNALPTRATWQAWARPVVEHGRPEGVVGLHFVPLVPRAALLEHLNTIRNQGYPQYAVYPPGERATAAPLASLAPDDARNRAWFGYDLASDPLLWGVLEQARDSGTVLFGPARTPPGAMGLAATPLLFSVAPLYREGVTPATLEARREQLLGWSVLLLDPSILLHKALAVEPEDWLERQGGRVRLELRNGPQLLTSIGTSDRPVRVRIDHPLSAGSQPWFLRIERLSPLPRTVYVPALLSLCLGLLITGLGAALLHVLLSQGARVQERAHQLLQDVEASEERLRASERRWKFALEGSGLGVWDWDLVTDRIERTSWYTQVLGYGPDELNGGLQDWLQAVHPDDRDTTRLLLQACQEGRTDMYRHEYRVRCKNGQWKWLMARGMVVARNDEGRPARMIGTAADTSERRALELDRERYVRFFQLSAEPMCMIDRHACLVQVNPALATLCGYAAEELQGRPLIELVDQSQRADIQSRLLERSGTRPAVDFEAHVVRQDGQRVLLAWHVFFDRNEGLCYAAGRDISQSRQHQERIEQLSRLYAALSACNAAIMRCTSPDELFAEICRAVVRLGGLKMAWIGLIDEASGRITPVQWSGDGTDYLRDIDISVREDDPHGRGPTGTAARENRPVWQDHYQTASNTAPWRERGTRFGWKASASLPICRAGTPIGTLTFYSQQGGWYDDETRQLLEEMAADISYALDKLDVEEEARSSQKRLQEAEQRFKCMVEQSIAGSYIIQEGRLVYANPRLQSILGYDSMEALVGRPVTDFVAHKDHRLLHEHFNGLLHDGPGRDAAVFTAVRRDGTEVEVGIHSSVATYLQRPAIIGLLQDISDTRVAEDQVRRYARDLKAIFLQTVGLATTLSELRDPYTAGHEQRVAELAVAIGAEMGLDENRLEGLRVGAYLHDVGKIRIPTEILSKPGRLTHSEYEMIKEHPQAGYDVLKDVDFPWPVAQIALQHHERMDGSGYPQGLRGDAIMLEARITAVADVVESMASHRPYRPGLGVERALQEIEAGQGVRYDSEVCAACLRLFRERHFVLQA